MELGRSKSPIESLQTEGIFYPHILYRDNLLYAGQGKGTVNDQSLLRTLREPVEPVKLVIIQKGIVVFDGNHRVTMAVFYKRGIPYQIIEANLPHIYPFHQFYNEFKRRLGRWQEGE